MDKPCWFLIAQQWKKKMGDVGVTLPFLVGALRKIHKNRESVSISSAGVLDEIINHPVEGFVTEVSLCPNISAPVISVVKSDDNKRRMIAKSSFSSEFTGGESLVLTSSIHDRQGFDCQDKNECLLKLKEASDKLIDNGQYSRIKVEGKIGEYIYGDFTEREIHFIESIASQID